jgi:hypothetical protein
MDQQADSTPLRRTTHSVTPLYPPRRGDKTSIEDILKNVEDNHDSFASGSIYTCGDDNLDDDEDEDAPPEMLTELYKRSVGLPEDYNNNILDLGRGRGRGRGRRSRGLARGRGRGHDDPVQDEDYTDKKVAFPLDMTLWPDYVRLSDPIHKYTYLTRVNQMPPPDAMKDGKSVAVAGKRGTLAHKNKHQVNFE